VRGFIHVQFDVGTIRMSVVCSFLVLSNLLLHQLVLSTKFNFDKLLIHLYSKGF